MTYLVDTNLLLYPHDQAESEKGRRASEVLLALSKNGRAALPAQALAEFANVALRKLRLPDQDVYDQLEDLSRAFPVLPLTEWIVLEALRGVRDHRFSYYDSQVWAAAKLNQMPVVLSEDFPGGATVVDVSMCRPPFVKGSWVVMACRLGIEVALSLCFHTHSVQAVSSPGCMIGSVQEWVLHAEVRPRVVRSTTAVTRLGGWASLV